jgi:hypothetical protein
VDGRRPARVRCARPPGDAGVRITDRRQRRCPLRPGE